MNTRYVSKNAYPELLDLMRQEGGHVELVGAELANASRFDTCAEPSGAEPADAAQTAQAAPAPTNVGAVSPALATHADLFHCRLGLRPEDPVCHAGEMPQPEGTVCHAGDVLRPEGSDCHAGADSDIYTGSVLRPGYPDEARLNAVATGSFFVHRLDITAPKLLEVAKARDLKLVHVRQGYTRCSALPVTEDAIITYDQGIAKPCRAAGMKVLLVEPGHVALPGYPCGFIGGCGGVLFLKDGPTLAFNGDITQHPGFGEIQKFTEERGVALWWIPEKPLLDIGSIV